MLKNIIIAGTAVALTSGTAKAAYAQDAREAQMLGYHQLCQQGDRKACIPFGMMLQQNNHRMNERRHNHPDWFWFER